MKISKVNIVLLIICLILAYYVFNADKNIKTVTKTEVKYDTITKVIDNTKPNKIEKVFITLKDTVKVNDTVTKVLFKEKKVNKYTYIDTLDNGRLESTILADTIYKRDIKLSAFNKESTKTITNTIYRNNIFLGGETKMYNKEFLDASVNLYLETNKMLYKIGYGINFIDKNRFVNLGIAFKLN
jgi:hypothetical protein